MCQPLLLTQIIEFIDKSEACERGAGVGRLDNLNAALTGALRLGGSLLIYLLNPVS
jgi:hypothetical protein